MFRTLTPIVSIILAVVIVAFFAWPMVGEVRALNQETTEYTEAVEKAREFNNQLQSLITQRNSFTKQELDRLDLWVPSVLDEVRALIDLKKLADDHGMYLSRVDVGEPEGGNVEVEGGTSDVVSRSDFLTMNISFQLIGSYDELKEFLADVERSMVLMEVTQLNFDAAEGDLQLYDITIQIKALKSS